MEHVFTQPDAISMVDKYLAKCKGLGFGIVELSTGSHLVTGFA